MEVLKRPRGEYLSGQEMSDTLGISRAAVWKQISALRGMGYAIEAVPSKGYRLSTTSRPYNDIEISSGLTTKLIGRNVHFHHEIASTNKTAIRMAKGLAPEGTVVVADRQSGGRGRLGRRWESPSGGIYTSIILRPPIAPRDAPKMNLMAAVAVAEAVAGFLPRPPLVKWPNDLLVDGRKISGILAEMDAEMDRVHFIVIGIGINVNAVMDGLPQEVRDIATSVREMRGEPVSRVELLQNLYYKLDGWYDRFLREGFAPVREAWIRLSEMSGRTVEVMQFDGVVKGTAIGIDEDGALMVRGQSGEVTRVTGGDVVIRSS
ncbi:MAG: biotin--[acetyl-CoA-carboxylase] ligase [Deltaproteobacteria bacterium]|nr:biotin--[acetyl-CoA-carboxylase] ligase [Deltaproteobacteria bacterium]